MSRPKKEVSNTDAQPPVVEPVTDTVKEVTPENIPTESPAAVGAGIAVQTEEPNESAIQAAADRREGKKRGPYKPRQAREKEAKDEKAGIPDFRKAGEEVADAIIALGISIGGEDWKPTLTKDGETVLVDERAQLREVWGDLAVEYKWQRFPPWAACAICTGMYIVPRITAPSTLSRFEKFKLWLKARKA